MNDELRLYLEAYNISKGWGYSLPGLIESLRFEKVIHKERVAEHRWMGI